MKKKKREKREEREKRETLTQKKKSDFEKKLSSQHNKASVSKAVDLLSRLERERPGDAAASSRVSFGQRYGMR